MQDANLLGTLEASNSKLLSQIITANNGVIHDTPSFYDNGTYNLSANDFGSSGTVDWWGAQAFVGYLNSISYKGSNQWALPSTPNEALLGYNPNNSQFGELFYNELGGCNPLVQIQNCIVTGAPVPAGPFSNVQSNVYWSKSEFASSSVYFSRQPYYEWDFTFLMVTCNPTIRTSNSTHGQLAPAMFPLFLYPLRFGCLAAA